MKKFLVFLAVMLMCITNCYAEGKEVNSNQNFITFNVDTELYNLRLRVYNNDTNKFVKLIVVSDDNKTFYFDKGLNLRFEDNTNFEPYKNIDNIYLFNESKVVDINRVRKDVNIEFTTIYRGYAKYIPSIYTATDVTIFDTDFNEVTTCKAEANCKMTIKGGNYFVKDNITGRITKEAFYNEGLCWISRYLIDGIYSEDELNLDNTTKKGNLYYFDEPVYPKEYTIDGEVVDFNDDSKYLYINMEGIFYKYSKKDKVIKDVANIEDEAVGSVDTNESFALEIESYKDDEVIIDVPNTEVNTLEILLYNKKNYIK